MCTALEAFLFAVLSAFISCVLLVIALTSRFVTKNECSLQHAELGKISRNQDLMFRMLRAIVVNLELPPEKKEEILNMRCEID